MASHGLNAAQREAVEAALGYRISLIQGFPGTGKSETAVCVFGIFAAFQ